MQVHVDKKQLAESMSDTRQKFGQVEEKNKEFKGKLVKNREISKTRDKYINISEHYKCENECIQTGMKWLGALIFVSST